MTFATAVVIGKFYPPHRGHKLLVDTALSQSHTVHVIVCAKPTDTIPGELRGQWIAEIHPTAHVMVIDDRFDANDTRVWAENTIRWLGQAPEAVFTSEDYGDPYASLMGAKHVSVDRARQAVPCSATMIRSDPYANWHFLEPLVRAWYAKRVCVLGAESTGTTTLAQALAERFNTVWTPEFGREYSALKQTKGETNWTTDEFVHIATEQNRREDEAARSANRIVIGDTNSFATCLWHRRYLGRDSAEVQAVAAAARCDLYLLTGDEIPFVQDGLRDGESIRHEMHNWFEQSLDQQLDQQTVPWVVVRGPPSERLEYAVESIAKLFTASKWRPN